MKVCKVHVHHSFIAGRSKRLHRHKGLSLFELRTCNLMLFVNICMYLCLFVFLILYPPMSSNAFSTITFMVVQDSQENPRLSGSSGHSACVLCSLRTVRRILDSRDPPDTLLVGCVVSGLSGGFRTGSSGHSARGLCSFRTVRRIPDCQDPPDTLLVCCVVLGHSGGSQTVGILRTLCSWVV